MSFENKIFLALLGSVPVIFILLYLSYKRKDKTLQKFASHDMIQKITSPVSWNIRLWKIFLYSLGILFILIAIARPKWGIYFQTVQNYGRDIVVLLDLSKSMLAEDVRPNRLARAKKDVEDLVDVLQGDRIALVAFAGRVETRCQLTLDYGFFKLALDECNPGVVAMGGTAIGDAIRQGIELLEEEKEEERKKKSFFSKFLTQNATTGKRTKAILLITDGEDHETAPEEAAYLAKKKNITLFTVGFGDDKEGARIPIITKSGKKEYLKNANGEIVWSRLNDSLLKKISLATPGGVYFPAKTRNIRMANVYKNYISKMEAKLHQSAKKRKKKERYQWFLVFALICFILESFLREGTKMRYKMILPMLLIFLTACSEEDNKAWYLNDNANQLYQEKKFKTAQEKYREAEILLPENSILQYNIANSEYSQKKWKEAHKYYSKSLYSDNFYLKTERLFNIAFNEGCLYYKEAELLMSRDNQQNQQITDIINLLKKSLQQYRKALTHKENDSQALHNLKFVKVILKNYIDTLYKKQQAQQKKQENSIAVLAKIRQMQLLILRQTTMYIDNGHIDKLKQLTDPQKQQDEMLVKFEKKIIEDVEKAKKQTAQQKKNTQLANQVKQMEQLLVWAKGMIQQAKLAVEESVLRLEKNQVNTLEKQKEVMTSLDPLWQILATPDVILQEDILRQTFVVNDITNLENEKKKWKPLAEQQQKAFDATQLFSQKFKMLSQALKQNKQKMPQGQPKINEAEIEKLTAQALKEQKIAKEHILKNEKIKSEEYAKKAWESLQKIAEKLGAKKQNQDQQQKQKKQENQQKKKQQQEKNKKKNKKQKKQKKQKKKMTKDQKAKMLQKVKDRMKNRQKKNQDEEYIYEGGSDHDW